jgi:hypothetical protein
VSSHVSGILARAAAVGRVPRTLAALWLLLALGLAAWSALASPRAMDGASGAPAAVVVLEASPPSGTLSIWAHLDEGRGAWAVLEAGERWSPAAELYWRRRLQPGWNHLIWDDLAGLADRGPVRLRLAAEGPARWSLTEARVTANLGPTHLTPIRGLLAAGAILVALALVRLSRALVSLARWLRRPRPVWPAPWTLGVLALSAAGLALRLHTLGSHSFWFDEVLTAIGAQSFAWVLYSPRIFGHPPLQYLAAWAMTATGAGEGWVRTPFALAGTASVVLLAALGRRLLGAGTGLVAAALLALSPFHVELSQLARPYAFLLALSIASFLALVCALQRPGVTAWLLFSALATLNLYAQYLAIQVLAVEALTAVVWLARRRWVGWPAAAVSFGVVAVLYLPWLPALARVLEGQAGRGEVSLAALVDLSVRVFVPQFLGPGLTGIAALALAGGALWGLRRRLEILVALGGWAVGPFAAVWIGQPAHFVAGRHLAFVMPPLMLLAAHGLTWAASVVAGWAPETPRLPRTTVRRAAVLCALALLLGSDSMWEARAGYYQRRHGSDWHTVADVLDQTIVAGDRVLATLGAAYPLRYYWRQDVGGLDPDHLPELPDPPAPGHQTWIITQAGWDEAPQLARWLAAHTVQAGEIPASWSLSTVRIHRARAASPSPTPDVRRPARASPAP